MFKSVKEQFDEFLSDAIDLAKIPRFLEYKNMSTNHAEQMIIGLMKEGKLYRYEDRIMVKKFNRIAHLHLVPLVVDYGFNKDWTRWEETIDVVRINLPFSPKHILNFHVTAGRLKRLEDSALLQQVVRGLLAKK